jgi:hypothetical protein
LTFLIISCRKDLRTKYDNPPPKNHFTASTSWRNIPYNETESYILGDPKQNPYTVRTMQSAYMTLTSNGIFPISSISIRPTHYYVKFKPRNFNQYEVLSSDSTLDLSDLPIEANIIQNGDYYHDPSLPDSIPTYQYTAIPVEYNFNDTIPYDIIDTLYIPESDSTYFSVSSGNQFFLEELLDQAYILTENFEDTLKVDEQDIQNRFYPGGRIRLFDTRLQQLIGMEGVRVQARRWFTYYNARTDYFGYYQMKHRFRRPCNYSIWFATSDFAIRRNLINTTYWINGPKIIGDWNYDISNGYQRFAGHVFRGAYRYHSKEIGGLKRPWLIRYTGRQIYIASNSYSYPGINWQFFPVIKIGRYKNEATDAEWGSDEIFSTTCHETAHSSHMRRMTFGLISYILVEGKIQESWAVAIEWFITHMEYSERGIADYGKWNYNPVNPPAYPNHYAYQYWNSGISTKYTPLFIDIVNNHNQLGQTFFPVGTGIVNDQVFGYSLPFIESEMLRHVFGLESLSNELKNHKPTGVTNSQIDLLLSFF